MDTEPGRSADDDELNERVRALCAVPVFSSPWPGGTRSCRDALERLAAEHREFVDRSPGAFSELVDYTAMSIVSHPALRAPIRERNERLRRLVAEQFWSLRTLGLAEPRADLETAAGVFVEALVGIELCHLIEDDQRVRDAAYDETVRVFVAHLTSGR